MNDQIPPREFKNLGTARIARLRDANFPDADEIVREGDAETPRSPDAVDIMLVNPPSPDGGIWIRSQHRVGRRSRENMVWPQVSLAQMAAILRDAYRSKWLMPSPKDSPGPNSPSCWRNTSQSTT